jgi:uncharacterized protein (TIGR02679 family)
MQDMENEEAKLRVGKAVAFFNQAGLSRLLNLLREKYLQMGYVGGQVILAASTPGERRNIASFLGKPPYPEALVKIKLTDVEKALKYSFNCTLPDVLTAFFPGQPLVTRSEQRLAHSQHQAQYCAALASIVAELPEGSRGCSWLMHGPHGLEWLFSRYKNAPSEEQEQQLTLVRHIVQVLDRLPSPGQPERLALFAQRTSGDPHALDPDRAAGRLFLLALSDLKSGSEHTVLPPQNRTQTLRLYTDMGLLIDTISSNVAVFNLAGAMHDTGSPDPLLQVAGKRVLLLPLRQVLEWQRIIPAGKDIYVFENPQVFEEVIAALDRVTRLPTIICTSGWPSVAALTLLDRLLAEPPDKRLFYSGDFDLKGLQIAAFLLARYPRHCLPWRFDTDTYLLALQPDGVLARANELEILNTLPDVFASLVTAMQEKKMWVYQESIAHLLVRDIKMNAILAGYF